MGTMGNEGSAFAVYLPTGSFRDPFVCFASLWRWKLKLSGDWIVASFRGCKAADCSDANVQRGRAAGLETCDTAGSEACATSGA